MDSSVPKEVLAMIGVEKVRQYDVTKRDIIEIAAKRTNQRKNHTKAITECVLDVLMEMLAREHRVEIRNFGVFCVKPTPSRIGRNPLTGESAVVPARNVVHFKAGKKMKNVVACDSWTMIRRKRLDRCRS